MPVMTKMRDSMPVVFAVLAGIFLLMIIFEWGGQGTIFSPKGDAETLGTVNGYKITNKDYNQIYESLIAQAKAKEKKTNLTETEEEDISENAWDQAISQALMNRSIEKMGITVTDQEVRDALFSNPPAEIRQQFTDSLGQFHQDVYIKQLRDPRNDSIVRILEAQTRDNILHVKWQEAMVSTVRVTDTEAYIRFMTDSAKAMVQVIKFVPPQPTPQQISQVSQQDAQAYYDSHSWLYKRDDQRKFKFVAFPFTPNARDSALAMETANTIKARLAEASLNTVDTVAKELAQDYSDLPYMPRHVITMHELVNDTSLMNTKPGDAAIATVMGRLTPLRVLSIMDTAIPLYRVRHIEVGFPPVQGGPSQQQRDSTKAVADQLVAQIKAGADFAKLAEQHSTDLHSASKGGDMGWLDTGVFPKAVRAEAAQAKFGEVVGPFETPRGYDILEVMGATHRAWDIVGVPLLIKPSHQTTLMETQMANIFREQAAKNGFDEAAKAAGYRVYSDAPPAEQKGTPIFGSHLFVDWLFSASQGDVSPALKMSKQHMMMVAQLTEVLPAGPQPLEEVKSRVQEAVAMKQAVASMAPRAKQLAAQIGPNGDLAAVAAASGDASLTPVTVVMGPAESVNGIPTGEYVINNWAYSAQPGSVSPPLKGEHGYYIAKLMGRNIPSQKEFETAKPNIVRTIFQEREQRMLLDWMDKQKAKAKIVDYRIPQR